MLELTAINAGYGHGRVVKDIALRVEPGEAVALLGRNGVGKTTLLRTIVGLHPARSGAIRWNGADITRAPAHRRAALGIAYVPQGRGIFPHLTVEENLRLGTTAAPAGGGVPAYIGELFPVLERLRRRPGGVLSGGEQQQLAIARALASRPKLLILDEPTEGIQPSIVQQIEATLSQIRKTLGIAILLVEQYLDFAWSIADRFYVMRRGRIVETGSPRERESHSVAHLLSV